MKSFTERRIILSNVDVIDPERIEDYLERGGYGGLRAALGRAPADVVEELKESGLRGRGGAGFPTGLKWEFVLKSRAKTRYVVCNADEGEPGTFKDRVLMEGDPHRLIEGMAICGYAVGARRGFIYVRGEYTLSIRRLERAIAQARERGLLGRNIMGSDFSFDIEIRAGAGAYVCGEETALLESMEGKRGWPRIRPPFPAERGFRGRPTVVNNVETLANVPEIVRRGAAWYRTLGTADSPGTKLYPLLGNLNRTGLVEAEMGIPLRTLVFDLGGGPPEGHELKGVLVGGAAGAFLAPDELDVPMDFGSLRRIGATLGSGSVLAFDDTACVVDLLGSVLSFFAHESCGQCTPCRVGTAILVDLLARVQSGNGDPAVLDAMRRATEVMEVASLCPLGQSVGLPVGTALEKFRGEFESHLTQGPCPRCKATMEVRV